MSLFLLCFSIKMLRTTGEAKSYNLLILLANKLAVSFITSRMPVSLGSTSPIYTCQWQLVLVPSRRLAVNPARPGREQR